MSSDESRIFAVVAAALRAHGDEPTGTVADAELLIRHLNGYKGAYEQLNREVGDLRSRVPSVRTTEEKLLAAGKPSLLLVSLPKSGTVFVGTTLARTLRYDYGRSLVLDGFPKNMVFGAVARDLAAGGAISTSHMQGDEWNIQILKPHKLTRIVLMVRDPRAALFSWFNYYVEGEVFRRRDRNEAFLQLPVEEQMAVHISGFFRQSLLWMTEWVDSIERHPELEVLELRYEDMVGNEEAYINRILEFYGLGGTPVILADKDKSTNFRTGQSEAWRSKLPPHLIEQLNSQIPERLFTRYRWAP